MRRSRRRTIARDHMLFRRLLLLAGALLAGAALVAAVALTRTWESPQLTSLVLRALSGEDTTVHARSVRLRVLQGVTVDDVAVSSAIPDGRLELEAVRLVLSHRPWRLLVGEIVVDEITIVQPSIAVLWDAPPSAPPTAGTLPAGAVSDNTESSSPSSGWDLDLRIERIAVENAAVVLREDQAELVRFDGLYVDLQGLQVPPGAPSMLLAASANGALRAARMVHPAITSQGVTAELELNAGKVVVADLQLPTALGLLEVTSLELDLAADPYRYTLRGGGSPLSAAAVLGSASGFGDGTLSFELDGDGSPRGGPRGRGSLEVAAGALGDLPVLAAVEQLLVGTEVVGRSYRPFAIPFALDGDLLTLEPFAVEADNLRLSASGSVDLGGPLALRLEVALPRRDVEVKEIPWEVLEALTDVDGMVKLPILLSGTIEAPKASFDRRAWRQLAQRRIAHEAGRALAKALFGE